MWERWDSMLPDGSINPGEMTSFNHYAFGGVADWMHQTIGGISALEPGYKVLRFAPVPGGGVTAASCALRTPYGETSCEGRSRTGRCPSRWRCHPILPGWSTDPDSTKPSSTCGPAGTAGATQCQIALSPLGPKKPLRDRIRPSCWHEQLNSPGTLVAGHFGAADPSTWRIDPLRHSR